MIGVVYAVPRVSAGPNVGPDRVAPTPTIAGADIRGVHDADPAASVITEAGQGVAQRLGSGRRLWRPRRSRAGSEGPVVRDPWSRIPHERAWLGPKTGEYRRSGAAPPRGRARSVSQGHVRGGPRRPHRIGPHRIEIVSLTPARTLLDCADRTGGRVAAAPLEASLDRFDRQDRRRVAVVITTDGRRVHMPIDDEPLADVSLLALLRSLLSLDGLLGLITGSRRENGGTRRDER